MKVGAFNSKPEIVGITEIQLTLLHPCQSDGHGLGKLQVVRPELEQERSKIFKRSPTVHRLVINKTENIFNQLTPKSINQNEMKS